FAEVFTYLTEIKKLPLEDVRSIMGEDFLRIGLQGWPRYLGDKPEGFEDRFKNREAKTATPKRQQQHL
ncbi:MAG: B12-binding domain-containing radical SAM protein, partial [Wohlfahrtiimonas sp.]